MFLKEGFSAVDPRIQDTNFMDQVVQRAYPEAEMIAKSEAARAWVTNVHPEEIKVDIDSEYCTQVSKRAAIILRSEGITTKTHKLLSPWPDWVSHAFLTANDSFLIDFQYRQFVEPELKAGLPDYIAAPFQNRKDLFDILTKHRVREDVYHYWTIPLFGAV